MHAELKKTHATHKLPSRKRYVSQYRCIMTNMQHTIFMIAPIGQHVNKKLVRLLSHILHTLAVVRWEPHSICTDLEVMLYICISKDVVTVRHVPVTSLPSYG
jgi:hypothetical protein